MDIQQPDLGSEVKTPQEKLQAASGGSSFPLEHEKAYSKSQEGGRAGKSSTILTLATRSIKGHRGLLAIIISYTIAGLFMSSHVVDVTAQTLLLSIYHSVYFRMLLCFFLFFLASHAIYIIKEANPDRLFPFLWKSLRSEYLTVERLTHSLPLLLATPLFFAVFTVLKSLIPEMQPFAWDATLAEWDALLHGGRHPWQWLQPILGNRWTTLFINILYNCWLLMSYAILFWQIFSLKQRETRRRFLLTFMTSWIVIGTAGALFFSSAGPCFFDQVSEAANPYAPLMAYLHEVDQTLPLWALSAQDYLWNAYSDGNLVFAAGISAMPSMHVAAAVLYALLGWRYNRLVGWSLTAYAVIIMIGSVHLGWHYAVDGYLGAIGALAIWVFFGWYGRRYPLSCTISQPE